MATLMGQRGLSLNVGRLIDLVAGRTGQVDKPMPLRSWRWAMQRDAYWLPYPEGQTHE